jgi:toxin YoeB
VYRLLYSPLAVKDAKKIAKSHLRGKCETLLALIAKDPYATTPRYEKLSGNLTGFFSRRINIQHRLVYEVDEKTKIIKVLRMWTHYE